MIITHTHTTVLRLFGFCPGQPGWAGTRRNIHPLTLIVVINHPYLRSPSTTIHGILHIQCNDNNNNLHVSDVMHYKLSFVRTSTASESSFAASSWMPSRPNSQADTMNRPWTIPTSGSSSSWMANSGKWKQAHRPLMIFTCRQTFHTELESCQMRSYGPL